MKELAVFALTGFLLFLTFRTLWTWQLREIARERMADRPGEGDDTGLLIRLLGVPPVVERYRWLCLLLGVGLGMLLRYAPGLPLSFCCVMAFVAALLLLQLEATVAEYRLMRVEMALSNSIDMMVGAMRAGAPVEVALESAAREVKPPLRGLLVQLLSRVRYGEKPERAIARFYAAAPVDSMRLFATTLAINWEAGGTLAQTLATIARSIRDGIEVGRRVRALTVQSRLTVLLVLLMTYFIGYIVWMYQPRQFRSFVTNPVGELLALISIALQGVGIWWVTRSARPRF